MAGSPAIFNHHVEGDAVRALRRSRRPPLAALATAYLVIGQVLVIGEYLASGASGVEPAAIAVEERSCGNLALDLCETLTVPVDHRNRSDGETIDVVFGLLQAERASEGTLVIAVGGPGYSGLRAAADYAELLPSSILDRLDIVTFDARGVGLSDRLACREAEDEEPDWAALAADGASDEELADRARRWSASCLSEAGVTADDIERYGTRNVVDDLEAYRRHRGVEKLMIYGESYGTLVAQLYAARYPEHTLRIVIDSPVDPTLSGFDFAVESAAGFEAALVATLAACDDDPICADDLAPGTAADAWAELLQRVEQSQVSVLAPTQGGAFAKRIISRSDLEATVAQALYTPTDRALLLRALAGTARGTDGALGELMAAQGYASDSPFYADVTAASYWATRCADYGAERAVPVSQIRHEANEAAARGDSLPGGIWLELPCLEGFEPADDTPLPLLTAADPAWSTPTLVLTATADPVTPPGMAHRIAERLPVAHVVETEGGPHVTFPSGWECPDDEVTSFLLDGDLPERTRTRCDGTVIDWYTALPLASSSAYGSAEELFFAIEENLFGSAPYVYWDGNGRVFPCLHGGTFTLRTGADADIFAFRDCALIQDWPMHGTASLGWDGTTVIDITAPDSDLHYEFADGPPQVTGVLNGDPVGDGSAE